MTFRPFFWLTIVTVPALALLVTLGTWQVQRLEWKLNLIGRIEARTQAQPQAIDTVLTRASSNGLDYLDYWPARVEGTFDHQNEMHLYGRDLDGRPGYFVLTPLLRGAHAPVLVNRGFVPESLKSPDARSEGQLPGLVITTGLTRRFGIAGPFTPDNQPADNLWFYADRQQIAQHLQSSNLLPVILEADDTANPGGWPLGGQTRLTFKNDHLGYAVTWFGLAVSLLVIYFALHAKSGRLELGVARRATDS